MAAFSPTYLTERLETLAIEHGAFPERFIVAFSGGADSVALLHALASAKTGTPMLAVHVDHGLHVESPGWAATAHAFAESIGIECRVEQASVAAGHDDGLEAAARTARYRVFERLLEAGDWLLSAHHGDDQAETLLLNALRGSGVLGLAGMPSLRPLGRGLLVRPLLECRRGDLESYANRHGLAWSEDPSNTDLRFDRNFLRHDILPRLEARWPAARASLARSASLLGEAQPLLDDLAAADLNLAMTAAADRLSLAVMRNLSAQRQRNLLRYAIRVLQLPMPPARRLEQILTGLIPAREDARPLVAWDGVEVRRYRDEMFILKASGSPAPADTALVPGVSMALGPGLGVLELERADRPGIRPDIAERGLSVRFRIGGERLRPHPGARRQRLKTLLQSDGVLPWMRDSIPLLFGADDLVAVADIWIAAEFQADDGYRVVWRNRPLIY